jgi:hypothetical protein
MLLMLYMLTILFVYLAYALRFMSKGRLRRPRARLAMGMLRLA